MKIYYYMDIYKNEDGTDEAKGQNMRWMQIVDQNHILKVRYPVILVINGIILIFQQNI